MAELVHQLSDDWVSCMVVSCLCCGKCLETTMFTCHWLHHTLTWFAFTPSPLYIWCYFYQMWVASGWCSSLHGPLTVTVRGPPNVHDMQTSWCVRYTSHSMSVLHFGTYLRTAITLPGSFVIKVSCALSFLKSCKYWLDLCAAENIAYLWLLKMIET